MKSVGEAQTGFKVSEFAPEMTDWGHTAYVRLETELLLDDKTELAIFFTPKEGTKFEDVERLAGQLDAILDKVHFNIRPR